MQNTANYDKPTNTISTEQCIGIIERNCKYKRKKSEKERDILAGQSVSNHLEISLSFCWSNRNLPFQFTLVLRLRPYQKCNKKSRRMGDIGASEIISYFKHEVDPSPACAGSGQAPNTKSI